MDTGLDMNKIPTAKLAYDALRQCKPNPDAQAVEGPTIPWEMLKTKLPREPKVFIIALDLPVGDEAPFMRLLAASPSHFHFGSWWLRGSTDNWART